MSESVSILLKSLGLFCLVLLNGFFVAAELALVKIRDTQVEPLASKGDKRARLVRHLIQNLDSTISATQFGITIVSLGLGVLAATVFESLLGPLFDLFKIHSEIIRHNISLLTGFLVNSYLLIVLGELSPKAIAIRKTLSVALWSARPLAWFSKLAFPFVWLMNHSAMWLLRRMGIAMPSESERTHSEEELRLLLKVSHGQASSGSFGRDIVLNALDLRNRIVRDVMRPRREIVVLDTDSSITECLDIAEKSRYSRFPLCRSGNMDNTLGVVHFKDLFAARFKMNAGGELASVARKLIYVPETARLEKLLQMFQERKVHLAIVVDEYGGTVGMVTLENILEEVVGPIQDEFDQEKPLLVKLGVDTWELAGGLPLHDLGELVQEPLVDENVSTVSGWVTQKLGGFPRPGDTLAIGHYDLRVEEMDDLRVARLKLVKSRAEDAGAGGVV